MNKEFLNKGIGKKKISSDALALLCSQFAIVLRSGVQLPICTKLIYKQCEDKKLKDILQKVSRDVENGQLISRSFKKHGDTMFPETFYETIKAGENTGNIENAFITLEEYFKKQSKISKQIKSALIYPVFVILVAVVVLIVIMVYVMPQMTDIFENMGGELPQITKIIIAISNFFSNNIVLIILFFVAMIIGVKVFTMSDRGKEIVDGIKLKIPFVGKIIYNNLSSQFAITLAMLLDSGLTMVNALKVLSNIFDNYLYKNAVLRASQDVSFGRKLADSMRKSDCFPNTLVEMTAIGEETGEIEYILKTVGDYYQNEADNTTKSFLSKLEPMLLIFVAVLAGFIVFAIYIPLFEMYDLF